MASALALSGAAVAQVALDEKIRLVFGPYATDMPSKPFVPHDEGRPVFHRIFETTHPDTSSHYV